MNSKQRAKLRALANGIDTILQVGKGGLSLELVKQVDDALEARELIKLRALDNASVTPKEAAEQIAEATRSEVVFVMGTRFVLYRKSVKNPTIVI